MHSSLLNFVECLTLSEDQPPWQKEGELTDGSIQGLPASRKEKQGEPMLQQRKQFLFGGKGVQRLCQSNCICTETCSLPTQSSLNIAVPPFLVAMLTHFLAKLILKAFNCVQMPSFQVECLFHANLMQNFAMSCTVFTPLWLCCLTVAVLRDMADLLKFI